MSVGFVQKIEAYCLFLKIRSKRGFRRGFLRGIFYMLTGLAVILFFSERQGMVMVLYAWLRKIDDIVDGEEAIPSGYDIKSYLQQKHNIIKGDHSSFLPEDILLVRSMDFFAEQGIDIQAETEEILRQIVFDCERHGLIISREALSMHNIAQDRALFMIVVKASGGDVHYYEQQMADFWGIFTKVDSLIDIKEDIKKGIINIPAEDIDKYGLNLEMITSLDIKDIPGFMEWFREEVENSSLKWKSMRNVIFGKPEMFLLNIALNATNIEITV
jgi:hypothetical protein